jgi:hypothetical protein
MLLDQANYALKQVEADTFHSQFSGEEGVYDNPIRAFGGHLEELYDTLLVVLEAAEMPGTRASLIQSWNDFRSQQGGVPYIIEDSEYEFCSSPAFDVLNRIIQGLRISVGHGVSSEEAWTMNRLEEILQETAALVRYRNARPANEHDLQKIMHDYLHACFRDFTPSPSISGSIKNFKPDCGIASVGAAIEFKIVRSKEDVALAFSGIAEDTAAYKGSKDWTRFYAVMYQAEPFAFVSHLRHDMKRIGAATWTPIVVNGPTRKKLKKKN